MQVRIRLHKKKMPVTKLTGILLLKADDIISFLTLLPFLCQYQRDYALR